MTKLEEIARIMDPFAWWAAAVKDSLDQARRVKDSLDKARRVIEALREPSGDMIDAGAESFEFREDFKPSLDGHPTKAWQAMCDAILKEGVSLT
jgi:hypothetical protein